MNTLRKPVAASAWRRWTKRVFAVVLIGALGAGAVIGAYQFRKWRTPKAVAATPFYKSAQVTQGDLDTVDSFSADAQLAAVTDILYRGSTTTTSTASGPSAASSSGSASSTGKMVTSVLAAGTVVTTGDVLYAVESVPVVALEGALPAWRALSSSSDDGPDITQLKKGLVALGYADAAMTIDESWDSDLTTAVKAFQTGYGLSVTGSVPLGQVAFVPVGTKVVSITSAVGASVTDGTVVLSLATGQLFATGNVPTGHEASYQRGQKVTIETGSGTTVDGVIWSLTSATEDGAAVVRALVVPTAEMPGVATGGSVTIKATIGHLANQLLVPRDAIASRIDGSYVVGVLDQDGNVSWVTVEVAGTSGLTAAVTSTELKAGDQVAEPK